MALTKKAALAQLGARRRANKHRERNTPQSETAHFDCATCGADIEVPTNWIVRPNRCPDCAALRERGWLP